MTFRTSWICRFCGLQRSSIAGSRFVMRRGIKTRKCAECVVAAKASRQLTPQKGLTMPVCAECGMPVDNATTYHPYAACLMFKACHNSVVVKANLDAVVWHGMAEEFERVRDIAVAAGSDSADAARYRYITHPGRA